MVNVGQMLTGPDLDKLVTKDDVAGRPNKPYLSRDAFEAGRNDLTLLSSAIASKVLMCYHNFEVYNNAVEKYREIKQDVPTRAKFEALVWTLRAGVKAWALETLNALGATSEIAFLEAIKPEMISAEKYFRESFSENHSPTEGDS